MSNSCLYRAIAESGILEREGMMDILMAHLPDAPHFKDCSGCNSSCDDFMYEDDPAAVIDFLEKLRMGSLEDRPGPKFAELSSYSSPRRGSSFQLPIVVSNPRVRKPQQVYCLNLYELSGDPRVDRQTLRAMQMQRETPIHYDETVQDSFDNDSSDLACCLAR